MGRVAAGRMACWRRHKQRSQKREIVFFWREGGKTEELREPGRSCWWRGNLQTGSRGGEQERKRSEDPLTLIPLGSSMILIYFAFPCFELFSSVFSHLRTPLTFGDHLCILLPVLEYSKCRFVIAFDFWGSCPCFSFGST